METSSTLDRWRVGVCVRLISAEITSSLPNRLIHRMRIFSFSLLGVPFFCAPCPLAALSGLRARSISALCFAVKSKCLNVRSMNFDVFVSVCTARIVGCVCVCVNNAFGKIIYNLFLFFLAVVRCSFACVFSLVSPPKLRRRFRSKIVRSCFNAVFLSAKTANKSLARAAQKKFCLLQATWDERKNSQSVSGTNKKISSEILQA